MNEQMNERERAWMLELLRERAGLRVQAALEPRLRNALSCAATELALDHSALIERAAQGDAEVVASLVRGCLVGESWFFRGLEQLEVVSKVLVPRALDARGRARIWSCCCSTGEEAWSLAALTQSVEGATRSNIELLGTDLNEHALTHARLGVYRAWSLRDAPREWVGRLLEPVGDRMRVRTELRAWPRFENLNLLDLTREVELALIDQPWDAIVCRNALMYLQPEIASAVMLRLGKALAPGGGLILGPTEPPIPEPLRHWLRLDLGSTVLIRPDSSDEATSGPRPPGPFGSATLAATWPLSPAQSRAWSEFSPHTCSSLDGLAPDAPPAALEPVRALGAGSALTDTPLLAETPSLDGAPATTDTSALRVAPTDTPALLESAAMLGAHGDRTVHEALRRADLGQLDSALELVDSLIAVECSPAALAFRAILLEAMNRSTDAYRAARDALIVAPRSPEAAIVAARTIPPSAGPRAIRHALARARRALVRLAPDDELALMPGEPAKHLLGALDQLELGRRSAVDHIRPARG